MPGRGGYAPLDASESRLNLRDGTTTSSEELSELERSHEKLGGGAAQHDDSDDDTGLLTGEVKELEREGHVLLEGKSKSWLGKVKISLRSVLLLGLAITIVLLLAILFHPSSPYYYSGGENNLPLTGWYSGDAATLQAGVFAPSNAAIAPNPLTSGAKFGDVPFASVGGSKASASAVPNWAGGDGGAKISEGQLSSEITTEMRWNGSHWFEPTVIIISLDGVRADYLERGLTPHLLSISKRGLRAEYMQPVFPSLTFPNHWTLQTGLYPASHGIVANDFLDPGTGKEFVYTVPEKSWSPKWWHGEPMWSTAVKAGLRSAVLMWPGPPRMLDGTRPTYWYAFHNEYHYTRKVDKIAQWLDMPLAKRPHLINAYAPEVDQEGHRTGPHSHDVEATLLEMDTFAKDVYSVLDERNLTDVVDVIFVSDHGMTSTDNERLVFLDDILGKEGFEGIERNEGWPSAGLRFASHVDEEEMLTKLLNASRVQGGFKVYTHETMPKEWHFSGNDRIAPIYVVPEVGWAVSNRHDFHVTMGGDYVPKGNHGYDPADPSMHAIFAAHGPFAERIKASKRRRAPESVRDETIVIPGFKNLELYGLAMKLLGIPDPQQAPNNGTRGFWDQYII